jgi:hypothetical protein
LRSRSLRPGWCLTGGGLANHTGSHELEVFFVHHAVVAEPLGKELGSGCLGLFNLCDAGQVLELLAAGPFHRHAIESLESTLCALLDVVQVDDVNELHVGRRVVVLR